MRTWQKAKEDTKRPKWWQEIWVPWKLVFFHRRVSYHTWVPSPGQATNRATTRLRFPSWAHSARPEHSLRRQTGWAANLASLLLTGMTLYSSVRWEWRLSGWRRGGVNPCNTRWAAPPQGESVCFNSIDILLILLCKQRQYYWYFLLSKMPFCFIGSGAHKAWQCCTFWNFSSVYFFFLLKTVLKCKHFRKLMKIIIEKTHVSRWSLQRYLQ